MQNVSLAHQFQHVRLFNFSNLITVSFIHVCYIKSFFRPRGRQYNLIGSRLGLLGAHRQTVY